MVAPSGADVFAESAPRGENTILLLEAMAGLLVALLGAVAPAGWAAEVRTGTALRTEENSHNVGRGCGS
ncbi:hypothetical protein [Streptomyces sp. NPDC004528]|uniref:hypothetical protein n=1 Tax=Streptomyces sp. NPDC004528 TaxID=3154550 RepID=UPI0033B3B7EE